MVDEANELLVLRIPAVDQNYAFRLAELPAPQAAEVAHLVSSGGWPSLSSAVQEVFSEPMNLREVLRRLPRNDFKVLHVHQA